MIRLLFAAALVAVAAAGFQAGYAFGVYLTRLDEIGCGDE